MKQKFLGFLILFSLSLCVYPTIADEPTISVKSEVDHAFFTIGDRVRFKVTVDHPSSVQIMRIDTSETLKDFEIKEEKDFKSQNQGMVSEGREVVLTSYELGDYVLSPSIVYYQNAQQSEQKQIESNKLYVSVESVDKTGKKSEDIAGIKGVVDLTPRWLSAVVITLLSLLLISIVVYWRYFQKIKSTRAAASSSLLSAHEEAYMELHRLYDSDLLRRGYLKQYYGRLSEIIRRYIERRYEILALESTTQEIVIALRRLDLDGKTLSLFKTHFESCDLVKFAKHKPEPSEIVRDNQLAKEIIDLTRPSETANPTAPADNASPASRESLIDYHD